VPGDDRRMATAPKLATSPWGHAIYDLRANAADRACFSAVRPVGRKNVCRRNDRSWGHCNSATYWPYYTAKYERPTRRRKVGIGGYETSGGPPNVDAASYVAAIDNSENDLGALPPPSAGALDGMSSLDPCIYATEKRSYLLESSLLKMLSRISSRCLIGARAVHDNLHFTGIRP